MTVDDGNDVDDTLWAAELEFNPRRTDETDAGLGAIAGFGGNSKQNWIQIKIKLFFFVF